MNATVVIRAPASPPAALETYRDDGLLARALGSAFGHAVRVPQPALLVAAVAPLVAAIAIGGGDAPRLAAVAVIAWAVLCAGVSSGRPNADPLRWTAPPMLRLVEYAGVIWLAAIAGASSLPAAFALLAAVAFRHYDLVYRLRYRGVTPPRWVGDLAGGWDGRLLLGCLLLLAGALPAGFFVAAGLLAAVLFGESVAGWTRFSRLQTPALYDDEEDEGH